MENHLKCFRGLSKDLTRTPIYCALGELEIRLNPEAWTGYLSAEDVEKFANKDAKIGHWEERLTLFEKLLLVKYFMREKLVSAVTDFVVSNFGKQFVESPPVSLLSIYADMTNRTPLVFVLSTGSDPMGAFLRFAKERKTEHVEAISLGQGQGPVAEKLLVHARQAGGWVFLQNCHLAKSFMPRLEDMVKDLKELPASKLHENFRLFLSSMPASFFPVAILQASVKVTNEPPKGLRSNIRGAFATISKSFFEDNSLGVKWRKMIFGICFFHAVVQERKKFGALGWNISYEFNDSDRECALLNMELFCKDGVIPWDALIYITGEITYGGRVRDSIDQRCLRTTLLRFFDEKTLANKYRYSQSGVYFAPSEDTLQAYIDYVNHLPINDGPEIFGMHNNANLSYQKQETNVLINTILDVQPRTAHGGAGRVDGSDAFVNDLASNILEKIEHYEFDWDKAHHVIFKKDNKERLNSLTTVLQQEVERYIKLRKVLLHSLKTLKKAIAGLVLMSEEMEKMYTSFLNNHVPEIWEHAAYPSLKPLGSWVKDFMARCNFMLTWLEKGPPYSFWISGFFFPQDLGRTVITCAFGTEVSGSFPRSVKFARCLLLHCIAVVSSCGEAKTDKLVTRIDQRMNWAHATLDMQLGFLTGALQNHARKYNHPIDRLSFHFHPLPIFRNQLEYEEEVRNLKFGEKSKSDQDLPAISDGVMIHGLYTDAFSFDIVDMKMVSELDRVMHEKMPLVHMEPKMDFVPPEEDYLCPVYKTAARAGVLSTTGHSTNFVIFIHLPSEKPPDFWISRGSAMLCGLGD